MNNLEVTALKELVANKPEKAIYEIINYLKKVGSNEKLNRAKIIQEDLNKLNLSFTNYLISQDTGHAHKSKINRLIFDLIDEIENLQPEINKPDNQTTSANSNLKVEYDLANIIELINSAFSDSELQTFCMSNFEKVYNNFAIGQSKMDRIRNLVDFSFKNLITDQLLELVKLENPAQFERHKPYEK